MKFYGELLIFVLLFITNIRVFFTKRARRDPLAVVAPVAFILSILQILARGIEVLTALGFLIGFLTLLSNFHALFRYSERLYIDRYSPLMKFWAVLTTILSVSAIFLTISLAPVELQNSELKISETETRYAGSFRAGFQKAGIFSRSSAQLYRFAPNNLTDQDAELPLILFFPDKRGDTQNYLPYLQLLAQKGCVVLSADFFSNDLKWLHSFEDHKLLRQSALVFHSLKNPKKFMSQREFYSYNISQECNATLKFVNELFSQDAKFYMVSDVMGNIAISDFAKMNGSRVLDVFYLDSVEEYKTAGYGCVEQTSPLVAYFLGQKRDNSFYAPKILVEKTLEKFNLNHNYQSGYDYDDNYIEENKTE